MLSAVSICSCPEHLYCVIVLPTAEYIHTSSGMTHCNLAGGY